MSPVEWVVGLKPGCLAFFLLSSPSVLYQVPNGGATFQIVRNLVTTEGNCFSFAQAVLVKLALFSSYMAKHVFWEN